jgi:hypothetical protein
MDGPCPLARQACGGSFEGLEINFSQIRIFFFKKIPFSEASRSGHVRIPLGFHAGFQ